MRPHVRDQVADSAITFVASSMTAHEWLLTVVQSNVAFQMRLVFEFHTARFESAMILLFKRVVPVVLFERRGRGVLFAAFAANMLTFKPI